MSVDVRCLSIIAVSILPIFSSAQEWIARYDGPGNGSDSAFALAVDDRGNVYVTGVSVGLATGPDYATVKYDSLGMEQWVARYNGPGDGGDKAVAITIDGMCNIYITGESIGAGTHSDYATVKYDSMGVEQWVGRYNGSSNYIDRATAIAVDSSGNVYITGHSDNLGAYADFATIKYDSLGLEKWVALYNGPGNGPDIAFSIKVDGAGNVYVTGASWGSGTYQDYATIKYDSSGTEQWVARYNDPTNYNDWATAIAVDIMGNVYVVGQSFDSVTHYDYATIKYDSSGAQQWATRYDGPANHLDGATTVAVDAGCNVYATGASYGSGTGPDYATIKYDSSGIEQWVARYDGPDHGEDYACALALSHNGNVCVTGRSHTDGVYDDYATVVYDSLGIELRTDRYNGPGNANDEARAIAIDNFGNVYVTGVSVGLATGPDYATIKYSPTGVEERELIIKKGNEVVTTIFSGSLQLPESKKCKVYDITGRVVEPTKIQPGIYFVEVDGVVTQKVVKIR